MEEVKVSKTISMSGNSLIVRITKEAEMLGAGAGDRLEMTIRKEVRK